MTNPTNPTTPGAGVTGVKPPLTMPVEQLIQSMRPEKPLTTDGGYSSGGYAPGAASTGSTCMTYTPQYSGDQCNEHPVIEDGPGTGAVASKPRFVSIQC